LFGFVLFGVLFSAAIPAQVSGIKPGILRRNALFAYH
jgi:hypothetical protein